MLHEKTVIHIITAIPPGKENQQFYQFIGLNPHNIVTGYTVKVSRIRGFGYKRAAAVQFPAAGHCEIDQMDVERCISTTSLVTGWVLPVLATYQRS